MTMKAKERILGLLEGRQADRVACFSGMGTVWGQALKEYGYHFAEVHHAPDKLAQVAVFPAQAYEYECAVIPFDICIEAETLGCEVNFYPGHKKVLYPKIVRQVISTENDLSLPVPDRVGDRARVPIVTEAIQRVKELAGDKVPVGSYVMGPYTLAGQVMDINMLLRLTIRKPEKIMDLLSRLTELILKLCACYEEAGVDYLTVREMSATTDILPPQIFTKMIKPHLKNIMANIRVPKILHICGNSLPVIHEMLDCGANAISVENKNGLAETRARAGPEPLIFGNLDGYGVLVNGTPQDVEAEVVRCLVEGSDGLWPSCEISLEAPEENLIAMIKATKNNGDKLWFRAKLRQGNS
ncbi:methyltransferase [Desulfofundulus salinus]|uniref:Methyltransferase n=2 Tax=Desulfofundulus salinus TaxID=2419843 RepID=A0A494X425_9FIRM|nr:methyltransferase [Desulfofundulus salinum]